jgi:hypothetical protein
MSHTPVDQLSLEQLIALREQFPYFGFAHAASARKMKNTDYFQKELTTASLYSSNRKQLRSFILTQEVEKSEVSFIKTESIPQPLIEEIAINDEQIENREINTIAPTITETTSSSPIDTSIARPFNQWLTLYAFQQSTTPAKETDDLDKLIEQSAVQAQYISTSLEQETHYSKGLDSFLESQKLKKKKLKSAQESEIVTETLALLYIKQGMVDKAIEVYTKLLLKNPEKSTYLATQIQKLKK